MSRGFSRVILIGRLGRDPEMRYMPNGTPVTNFTIAVNRFRRDPSGGERIEETDWYRISFFRQQAENAAEWLRKGNRVLVEGQLQIRSYTGQDGIERTSVEVNGDTFVNLTGRDEAPGGPGPRPIAGEYESAPPANVRPMRPGAEPAERFKDDDDDFDDVPF